MNLRTTGALLLTTVSLFACDNAPGASSAGVPTANGSAPAGANAGAPVGKGNGVTVIRSATPKVSEAQFMKALDKQLDATFVELRNKPYRSQVQVIVALGSRMQPQVMMRETRIAMGVSDVAVLSLFASTPDISRRVGAHVQQRAKVESAKLQELTKELPKVVAEDCREAAEKKFSLQQLAAGKRKPTPADKVDAPMVAVLLNECKVAAEGTPAFACYLEAKDDAELKACK